MFFFILNMEISHENAACEIAFRIRLFPSRESLGPEKKEKKAKKGEKKHNAEGECRRRREAPARLAPHRSRRKPVCLPENGRRRTVFLYFNPKRETILLYFLSFFLSWIVNRGGPFVRKVYAGASETTAREYLKFFLAFFSFFSFSHLIFVILPGFFCIVAKMKK